jgi:fructokinase
VRIGVDLGGTKIEAIALADDNSELARERVATPRNDYDDTVGWVRDLVTGSEERLGERGTVGMGIPGSLSPATKKPRQVSCITRTDWLAPCGRSST